MTSTTGPSLCERYHAATIYTREAVQKATRLDFDAQPSPFKSWYQARRVELAGGPSAPIIAEPGRLDAERLGRLLYHTYGVTLVREFPGMSMHFRASPSAGGLYPTELYVAVRGIDGIPDGILDYHAPDHSLVICWEGDFWRDLSRFTFDHPAVAEARAVLIGTGVYERSAWRYRDRAYRRVLLDTGHVFGNAVLSAPRMGQRAIPIPHFLDEGLNSLLLLDPSQEGTLLLAAIVDEHEAPTERPVPMRSGATREASEPAEGTWIPVVHDAGKLAADAPARMSCAADAGPEAREARVDLDAEPLTGGAVVLETIRRRRSTRRFQPAPVTIGALGRLLAHAYPSPTSPEPDAVLEPGLLDTYLVISAVTGLRAGVYRYLPGAHQVELVRAGNPRSALYECCLRQQLGYDCAFAVVHTFDLTAAVGRLGDRAYRTAHLEAGVIGQRLNVGALQLDFGASGIGGFFDDCVSSLVGLSAPHAVAYVTTIGIPA